MSGDAPDPHGLSYVSADEALALFGELMAILDADPADFLRDWNLLESALARPRHAAQHEDAGSARQAATLLCGITRNHPFLDGNKRAAHLIAVTFLEVNGFELGATEDEQFDLLLGVARGELDVDALEGWIRIYLRGRQA